MDKTTRMKWEVEYTDTFGGEANYAWVKRAEFDLPEDASDLAAVRKAKALLGLNGVRCRRDEMGEETIRLVPYGTNTVLFVTPCP